MPKGIPKNGMNKGWFKKGQKFTEDFRKKMSLSHKGVKPHRFTRKTRIIMSKSAKLRVRREMGERMWKGNRLDYYKLHHKIRKLFGNPNTCEMCKKQENGRKIHWANIDGVFNLDKNNWIRLCSKCHYQHDRK